jgi:hypothetical protein
MKEIKSIIPSESHSAYELKKVTCTQTIAETTEPELEGGSFFQNFKTDICKFSKIITKLPGVYNDVFKFL